MNKAKDLGIKVYNYSDVLEEGKKLPDATFKVPTSETIHMFCYTSGTTGDPKAAMMSHGSFIPVIKMVDFFYAKGLTENEVAISYLPYAHIFE